MEINPELASQHVEALINGLIRRAPNVLIGTVVLLLFWMVRSSVDAAVTRLVAVSGRSPKAAEVFGRLARYVTVLFGVLVALMIIVPGFQPASLLGALGIGSVAIGFAFRDVLQNFLAGFIILLTEPFQIGDQIVVDGHEGTVDDIEVRSTELLTFDGRRVVIPNGTLLTNSVVVNTAGRQRRAETTVSVAPTTDVDALSAALVAALQGVPEVVRQPAPTVRVAELGESALKLSVAWWSAPDYGQRMAAQHGALRAIRQTLAQRGVGAYAHQGEQEGARA